jgi:cellulose synthase (UDP-forming)
VLVIDAAEGGVGLLLLGGGAAVRSLALALVTEGPAVQAPAILRSAGEGVPRGGMALALVLPEGVRWTRIAHARRVLPGVTRLGLAFVPAPPRAEQRGAYLAA